MAKWIKSTDHAPRKTGLYWICDDGKVELEAYHAEDAGEYAERFDRESGTTVYQHVTGWQEHRFKAPAWWMSVYKPKPPKDDE